MAKKGQAVQLQTEVNTDEDWEKLLAKDGLIIVDVYSEWCGPCSAMAPNLKKIKLEIGGDLLQLAVAKSDTIAALERFRNKSEPTWMFLSRGKRVNFMFGANAPRLTRLITEELRKETDAREGKRERVQMEISDLADEERERYDAKETKVKAAQAIERAKRDKELRERRVAECQSILETLSNLGIILIFPHARDRYMESFGDLLGEAGVTIGSTEKNILLTEAIIEELLYFTNIDLPEILITEVLKKKCLGFTLKRTSENLPNAIDDIVLQIAYGNSREPPGGEKHPYQLLKSIDEASGVEIPGIWIPPNSLAKATALKLLFPNISGPFKLADVAPIPPHILVGYDAFKYKDVLEISAQFPNQVMAYGFFTSDIPGEGQLIAKNVEKFENRTTPPTYEEKIVIKLSKTNPECLSAFSELGPSYMSANALLGGEECKMFFPADYCAPEESAVETKKKSKKKGKVKPIITNTETQDTAEISQITEEVSTDVVESNNTEQGEETALDENGDGHTSEEHDEEDDEGAEDATDKATSPIDIGRVEEDTN